LRVHYSSDFITFFVCILHKFAYSQIKQDGLEFQILGTIWLLDCPDLTRLIPMHPPPFVNMTELLTTVIQVGGLTHHFLGKCLYQVRNVLFFSCSVDWKLRWLSFLSVLSVFVDFPFWMSLGVRYHCYYLYSVVCQQICRNVLPLSFPRYTGVKKTQHYKLFISNPIVLFWRIKKKIGFFLKWKGIKGKKGTCTRYVGFF
jgi:hypothetical protein